MILTQAVANLQALGIEVPLGLNTYTDHGYVPSVGRYRDRILEQTARENGWEPTELAKVKRKLRQSSKQDPRISELSTFSGARNTGYCLALGHLQNGYAVHIFYVHDYPLVEIQNRGHEEGHALHHLGGVELLRESFLSHGVNLGHFAPYGNASFEEKELLADVSGVFALVRRGHPLDSFHRKQPGKPGFERALSYCLERRI